MDQSTQETASYNCSRHRSSFDIWGFVFVIALVIVGSFIFTNKVRADASWLSGYDYRTKIPVEATVAGEQTDYQMSIILHSGAGTNAAGIVYFNDHLQDTTNFNDIRFTASDGTTLKNYWIQKVEDETGGRKATVYVKLDTPASGTADYYVYYGKTGDASTSSYDNTFTKDFGESGLVGIWHMDETPGPEILQNTGFENWTGNNIDNWTIDGASAGTRDVTKETSTVYAGTNAVKLTATNAGATSFGIYQDITTTNNENYQLTISQRFNSRTAGILKIEAWDNTHSVSLGSQSVSTTSTAYSTVNVRFTSTNTTNVRIKIYLTSETTTGVVYVDAISVRQSGNTLADSSPSANPAATIYGAARTDIDGGFWGSTNQQFSTGSSINFDGKDDYVDLGTPSSIQNLTSKSVFLWVKPTGNNGTSLQRIYYGGYAGAEKGDYISVEAAANFFDIYVMNTSSLLAHISSISFIPGNWYLIGYTWDGSNVRFYKNGVQLGSTQPLTGIVASNSGNRLGAYVNGTQSFNGTIDDTRIYNRALTSEEISRQYIRSKYTSTDPTWSTPNLEEQLAQEVNTVAVNTSDITIASATLNGSLTGLGGDTSVTVSFNYGLASDNLDQTTITQTMTDYGSFSQAITNLTANTTYYFQAVVTNSAGTTYGSILSFNTAAFDTDYYRTIINADGSLTFTDKNTGATVLSNSPRFYLNYNSGKTILEDVTPPNSSFETDTNSDGIPDGWTVNKTYIRQSSELASDGTKSLKINMTSSDTDHRRVYSPIMLSQENAEYSVSTDFYLNGSSSLSNYIYIYYYNTTDGTGTAYGSEKLASFPVINDSWKTKTFNWIAPKGAKSFKLMYYFDKSDIGSLYIDNVKVVKQTTLYDSNNSSVTSEISTSGNNITITSTDDSSATTTISNRYELSLHSPYIKYTPTLTYKQNTNATEERFDFTIPSQSASIMTRDLNLNTSNTGNVYYSDQYTPKVVKFDNGLSFLGNDTMQSMQLKASGSANSQLSFYSDYSGNHPFSHYVKNGGGSIINMSSTKRSVGDTYSTFVTFSINPRANTKSLVKTRQPYGYDATVTLTNHADSELLSTINAVTYGTEDTSSQDYGTKGIVGRGIGWTKSVFVLASYPGYDNLSSPDFKSLHDKLYQDGVEIVGHSISSITDSRTIVESGLQTLSQYGARNWIDHGAIGGTENLEDLRSQGTIKGDPNYSLDLFDQYGYQYAWSYDDLTTAGYGLNILQPAVVGDIRPFFFYNNNVDDNLNDNKKIYLWSSLNTDKVTDLYYTNANIDSLISDRGLHIGHEYMGTITTENHAWYTNPATGKIEIYPTFDSELAYIAQKKADGLIWSPTVATLGDYLVPLKDVLITNNTDGSYTVTNNSSSSITGVTLLAESAIQSVTIDGKELTSFGGDIGDKELVLPTLTSGQSVNLNITYGTKDTSVPTIISNDTGKNKVNEVSSYWDSTSKRLTMTAEGKSGDYSFTATIPSLANKNVKVEETGTNTVIGNYVADSSGEISFTAHLGSLHTFDMQENTDTVSTPVATPVAGTYNSTQSVTLHATGSNSIRYTTDIMPTDCSAGTLYSDSTPIVVSSSQTIHVRACDNIGNSSTTNFVYVISPIIVSHSSSGGSSPSAMAQFKAVQQALNPTPAPTVTTIPSVPFTPIVLSRIIKLSNTRIWGDDVKALQTLLKTKGYDVGTPDGNFGPKTQAGVIAFQKANNLAPDGVVGPNTLALLNNTTPLNPVVSSNPTVPSTPTFTPPTIMRVLKITSPRMGGNDVLALQTYLNAKGFDSGIPDSNFGPKTQAAVMKFQVANNLAPDGVVGPKTRAVIDSME